MSLARFGGPDWRSSGVHAIANTSNDAALCQYQQKRSGVMSHRPAVMTPKFGARNCRKAPSIITVVPRSTDFLRPIRPPIGPVARAPARHPRSYDPTMTPLSVSFPWIRNLLSKIFRVRMPPRDCQEKLIDMYQSSSHTKDALVVSKEQHRSRIDDHEPDIEPFPRYSKVITNRTALGHLQSFLQRHCSKSELEVDLFEYPYTENKSLYS